ncbi:MAG: esterase [Mediterranea sp.]|jgi:enterochelin esterase family protein|nr:esterase [Mediterranea sp.]
MKNKHSILILWMAFAPIAITAQTFATPRPAASDTSAARAPRPAFRFPPRVISPQVNADGTVTFRFSAPNATRVELAGQFLDKNLSLAKDEKGLWSVTTGKVKPDIYPYNFVVDGTAVADPNNVDIFPNERFKASLVDVRGKTPATHDLQDVPHGKVTYAFYHSRQLGLERPLLVYTPPGYTDDAARNYPVLYLIHGMTDTHETWYKVGRVNYILDNLIAAGKAEPMIVVMPYANPYPALMKKDPSTKMDLMGTRLFTDELLLEIIPYVESRYRAKTGRDNRAIAGFSLGGRQALGAGLSRTEEFAYVCPMAPAVFPQGIDKDFADVYASPEKLRTLKLLWIGCGKDDGLYEGSKALAGKLDAERVKHETFYSTGGHTWMNCRLFLATVAPKLFTITR